MVADRLPPSLAADLETAAAGAPGRGARLQGAAQLHVVTNVCCTTTQHACCTVRLTATTPYVPPLRRAPAESAVEIDAAASREGGPQGGPSPSFCASRLLGIMQRHESEAPAGERAALSALLEALKEVASAHAGGKEG